MSLSHSGLGRLKLALVRMVLICRTRTAAQRKDLLGRAGRMLS